MLTQRQQQRQMRNANANVGDSVACWLVHASNIARQQQQQHQWQQQQQRQILANKKQTFLMKSMNFFMRAMR